MRAKPGTPSRRGTPLPFAWSWSSHRALQHRPRMSERFPSPMQHRQVIHSLNLCCTLGEVQVNTEPSIPCPNPQRRCFTISQFDANGQLERGSSHLQRCQVYNFADPTRARVSPPILLTRVLLVHRRCVPISQFDAIVHNPELVMRPLYATVSTARDSEG